MCDDLYRLTLHVLEHYSFTTVIHLLAFLTPTPTLLPPLLPPSPPSHLLHCGEVVSEVGHEVHPCVWSHKESNPTEVCPGVARHQGVANPTDHPGETNQCLSEFTICQKAVALQDGCLNVAVVSGVKNNYVDKAIIVRGGIGMECGGLRMEYGSMGMEYWARCFQNRNVPSALVSAEYFRCQ